MTATDVGTAYDLRGSLLEACSCGVLCPCWVGEDPDTGTCDAFLCYHFDLGTIRGVNVADLNFVVVAHIPGNVLQGDWKVGMFVDDRASDDQMAAIVDAFTGALGGPLADLAQLVGDVRTVERAPVEYALVEGTGKVTVGDFLSAEMTPYRGPNGDVTTLRDTIFSTVPGSPAWVSKAVFHKVDLPALGWQWTFEGRNAIQADWMMVHPA
jgi:hypothetical protein